MHIQSHKTLLPMSYPVGLTDTNSEILQSLHDFSALSIDTQLCLGYMKSSTAKILYSIITSLDAFTSIYISVSLDNLIPSTSLQPLSLLPFTVSPSLSATSISVHEGHHSTGLVAIKTSCAMLGPRIHPWGLLLLLVITSPMALCQEHQEINL